MRTVKIAIIAIIVTLVVAACVPPVPMPSSPGPAPAPSRAGYTGPAISGPENVTFLYHTIAETRAAGQLANIGHPRDLVYITRNDATTPGEAAEPAYAHSIGAKAYKYLQLTTFPTNGTWLGMTEAQRGAWTLCQTGNTKLYDNEGGHGSVAWSYADTNERGYVNAVLAWTARLKAMGYDGVFIDAGGRAIRRNYWNVASTCTNTPVKAGERSSNSWMAMLMAIKAQGFKVSANMGAPTADPLTRPDPFNPASIKTDVRAFSWILHENAGHPKENYPSDSAGIYALLSTFDHSVAKMSDDALYARGQVVEMSKARLPANSPNRVRQEQYVWAIAKLSGQPVVMNTGYDFCGVTPGTTDCSRTGLTPGLVDLRLGTPIDAAPYKTACTNTSCMWVRRFQKGLVVVSAYGTPQRASAVSLGVAGCRRVNAYQGGQQAGGKCVTSFTVDTRPGAWAHIYLYSA